MGEVYKAKDTRLERTVAVKVLPQALAQDPDALTRFEREALAVAALSHPNILSIFDFGTEEGTAYAVMELLEGDTLRGKIDSGPIPQGQAVDYALQIARGLSAAHEKSIVHRDLKPENLFVTKDGHLKILDFGLAKREEKVVPGKETRAPTSSGHTAPGTVMGTVGYMSPEQVRGLPVDHRSDIFSFGAILYEMLSGLRAFKRDTASDTMAAIMRDEPPELSETGRNIPIALDHVVRHCLEKERENRFQAVKDVTFALSEASGPTTFTSGVRAITPARGKNRFLVAAAVVAAIVVGGAFLMQRSRYPGGGTATIRRIAVLPFENLGSPDDEYFADGIADEIRSKLTTVKGLEVIARGSSIPYKKTTKTPKQIADELNARYLLVATVRFRKEGGTNQVHVLPELVEVKGSEAAASRWQQPFDAALTNVFQVQSEIASRVAQELGVALGSGEERRLSERPTENLAAYDAFLKGEQTNLGGAATDAPRLRKALGFYEEAVALDPSFAQAWARVSVVSSALYFNGTPTPELAERARKAAEKAVTLAPDLPDSYHALGNYERFVTADYKRALEQYAKGRAIAPSNAQLLGAAGLAEKSLGLWDVALEHLKQAERLDPRSAVAAARLAGTLLWVRRYREAREAIDRGLSLAPAALNLIAYKAMTFLGEGDLAGARNALKAAEKDVEPTALVAYVSRFLDVWLLEEGDRELLQRLTPSAFDDNRGAWGLSLAEACVLKGDQANVRVYAEEARKAFEEQIRATQNDGFLHGSLGLALAYLGRKEEAIREGLRGVELIPVAKDAAFGPGLQGTLVQIYTLVGEPEKALDQLEPLLKIPSDLSPAKLKIDPNFDPLRKNPRFKKLVGNA
jgi:serine/threonine protein kinase/tetratricopeptide (TPR) repeat protein